MFTIIISALLIKIGIAIQFNEIIGPLMKIVEKMGTEFLNFLIFYMILTLMFVMVGTVIFIYDC